MESLELTPAVFSILNGLVEEKVGLHYGLLDRDLLREKASGRAIEAGFDSLLDYYYFLRYDPAGVGELDELAEALVVGETYFFREWPAIRTLVDSFVVPWVAAGRRPRIWSAACATGEEPLSLAMLLEDRGLLNRVDIVASDLSARALARAQEGRFGRRSVRQVPEPRLVERYLRDETSCYRVAPELIRAIQWRRHNLLDVVGLPEVPHVDVVLCRNVLIYFADPTVRQVLDNLARPLARDGVLLVGVSESLMRYGSSFEGEERGGTFVYRKAGHA